MKTLTPAQLSYYKAKLAFKPKEDRMLEKLRNSTTKQNGASVGKNTDFSTWKP